MPAPRSTHRECDFCAADNRQVIADRDHRIELLEAREREMFDEVKRLREERIILMKLIGNAAHDAASLESRLQTITDRMTK